MAEWKYGDGTPQGGQRPLLVKRCLIALLATSAEGDVVRAFTMVKASKPTVGYRYDGSLARDRRSAKAKWEMSDHSSTQQHSVEVFPMTR